MLVVSFVLLTTMLVLALPTHAYAGSSDYKITKLTKGTYKTYELKSWEVFTGTSAISNVKVSNVKVVKAKAVAVTPQMNKNVQTAQYWLEVKAKKAGKATISFSYKGKRYKCKYRVYKHANPFSEIRIGMNDFLDSFKKARSVSIDLLIDDIPKPTGKLVAKAAKNWKIKSITLSSITGSRAVKSGVSITKKTNGVSIECKSKKTGVVMHCWISWE